MDNEKKLIAAVTPVVTAANYLSSIFDVNIWGENIEQGHPFAAEVTGVIDNELIKTFSVP